MCFWSAHLNNKNVSAMGIVNTMGFAVVLGCAFIRSGDLWLPIGIHFGWNWTLPLFGENLSGFTMGMTGVTMHWYVADIWSGGSYGPEASLLTCGVVIALLFYLVKAPVLSQEPVLARSPSEDASTKIRSFLVVPLLSASLLADSQKLNFDQRVEIVRGLMAEYATVKTFLPRAKKPLVFESTGTYDKKKWEETVESLDRRRVWATWCKSQR